eukprot:TRINITY_DN21011_c0_g1_i1.p1 TRINITY_DN21011_c0_g1~~TRINITY_DN21011_c0_g1_i1.p1  ORF type:complete len:510 (-),score=93.23 TRINITY_DN21011_c0_g1_i1:82-1527(-)
MIAVPIPAMKIGRCFPAAVGLAKAAPFAVEVSEQARQPRNEMCAPVSANGSLNLARHEVELRASVAVAEDMIAALGEDSATSSILERLRRGHVIEEDDLEPIAVAMNFGLNVSLGPQRPYEADIQINPGADVQHALLFTQVDMSHAGHWEAIKLCPPAAVVAVCRQFLGTPKRRNAAQVVKLEQSGVGTTQELVRGLAPPNTSAALQQGPVSINSWLAIPPVLRKPWQVFREDIEEDPSGFDPELFVDLKEHGEVATFARLPDEDQMSHAEVSLIELAAWVSWKGQQGRSDLDWCDLQDGQKAAFIPENFREVLIDDGHWRPLVHVMPSKNRREIQKVYRLERECCALRRRVHDIEAELSRRSEQFEVRIKLLEEAAAQKHVAYAQPLRKRFRVTSKPVAVGSKVDDVVVAQPTQKTKPARRRMTKETKQPRRPSAFALYMQSSRKSFGGGSASSQSHRPSQQWKQLSADEKQKFHALRAA